MVRVASKCETRRKAATMVVMASESTRHRLFGSEAKGSGNTKFGAVKFSQRILSCTLFNLKNVAYHCNNSSLFP